MITKKIFVKYIGNRWNMPGGYRELLWIAVPLILSTGTYTIQQFLNRIFLTWYSQSAIAASMPAGILNMSIISIFMGTVNYVSVFIAQYYGAGGMRRIGAVVWHGIYIAFFGGTILLVLIPLSGPVFNFIGHDPAVRADEIVYFRFLTMAAFPSLAAAAMAGFYSGRGKTWTIVLVDVITITINMILDYILIFGNLGFPELGIKGSGIATVIASSSSVCIYFILISRKSHEKEYATRSGWKFDPVLIKRLLRFGLPSGMHLFLDMAGFAAFILIMGKLGTGALAATNIAFNINSLAFMPMLGCGIAVSILVGQKLGAKEPGIARQSVWSGFHLAFIYMITISVLYLTIPSFFTGLFAAHAAAGTFEDTGSLVRILLRFVAIYSMFDAMNIIFSSAIKGAGDTHYVMRLTVAISAGILVLPAYIALEVLHMGIFAGWTVASVYIGVLGLAFLRRFLSGKWESMSVIESAGPVRGLAENAE